MLTIEERISNAVDEMNRATERLREIGDVSENTITSDSELISDMESSIERLEDINDIVGLALIIAGSAGEQSERLYNNNIEYDSVKMRKNYLQWALEILLVCQRNNWEDYYDTAWTKAKEEIDKLCKGE